MCGITGIYNFNNQQVDEKMLNNMTNSISHRGPDSGNIYVNKNLGVGHRRLSIIDLSQSANQPMFSENQNFVIAFNGEIYNFRELKDDLIKENYAFRTSSDTEVILNGYIAEGVSFFKKLNGMFSISILDIEKNELILARDPFGIKPLYYLKNKNLLAFGSEMKPIKQLENINLTISNQGLTEYLWFGNPLGNNTIYNEIHELSPGTCMVISTENITQHSFFDPNEVKLNQKSEKEIVEDIKNLFDKAIERHLISDVPVGVFLSGGIDSSAITAFASKYYKNKLNTYSVKFDYDKGDNELPLAKKVAEKFNTNHHEVEISGKDLINVIESLVEAHDEPFGDAANIPLYLLTRKLKGEIKVVLQGDGGDEFFGGYSRYNTIVNKSKWIFVSKFLFLLDLIPSSNNKLMQFKRFLRAISQKEKYKRNALLLTMESKYSNPIRVLNDNWKQKVAGINPFKRYKEVYDLFPENISDEQAIYLADAQIILKDTFFEKVDKPTMSNSMEVRVPFLDKYLATYAMGVSPEIKTKNGEQKYLLKKAMRGVVPDEILDGKKKGFGVPYGYWLSNNLEEHFKEQLNTEKVKEILDVKEILSLFNLHKKNKGNYGFLLWKTYIFSVWINKNNLI